MKHKVEIKKQAFSKIFRWQLPKDHPKAPAQVEVIGTFTGWKPVPMTCEISGGWEVALHEIPGHRTHHYMLLADGKPVQDRHSDGLAIPHGAEEEKFAITTVRGPRVFMLFAQTK